MLGFNLRFAYFHAVLFCFFFFEYLKVAIPFRQRDDLSSVINETVAVSL